MNKLTIEKAREIVEHPENYGDIGPLGWSQVWEAQGFIKGWESRQPEVDELERYYKKLTGDEWPKG